MSLATAGLKTFDALFTILNKKTSIFMVGMIFDLFHLYLTWNADSNTSSGDQNANIVCYSASGIGELLGIRTLIKRSREGRKGDNTGSDPKSYPSHGYGYYIY